MSSAVVCGGWEKRWRPPTACGWRVAGSGRLLRTAPASSFSLPSEHSVASNGNTFVYLYRRHSDVIPGESVPSLSRSHSGRGCRDCVPFVLLAQLLAVGEALAAPELPCHVLPCLLPVSLFRLFYVPNMCASFHLELSAEAKAALLEFEERERQHKQGRYGSRRGGRRGGSLMCRGLGDQRRENSDRGRMKDHRPALLPTQPPVVVMLTVSL